MSEAALKAPVHFSETTKRTAWLRCRARRVLCRSRIRTQIVLGHGSGGKAERATDRKVFLPAFSNPLLNKLDDQAVLDINGSRLAFTTDAIRGHAIFFPGGDIGRLAINGTVNDLAMSGARPLYLAAAFILEEGLATDDLRRIVRFDERSGRRSRRATGGG